MRHLKRNVVSYVALFVALGGSASAATLITANRQVGANVIAGSVPKSGTHDNLIAGTLGGADLDRGVASRSRIASAAVDASRIADESVKTPDLASGAAGGAALADRAVTEAKLGPDTQRRIDVSLTADDATNQDFDGVQLFELCHTVDGATRLTVTASSAASGDGDVQANTVYQAAGGAISDTNAGGTVTSLSSATRLPDAGDGDGQAQLAWTTPGGAGSGVLHYGVSGGRCVVQGVLVPGS
jgi:hypothetical protein